MPIMPQTRAANPVLFAAVAQRYAGSRFAQGYVRSKLKHDPATAAILDMARHRKGLGRVVDLGCGRGQLSLALLLAGLAETVTGLDRDSAKIAEARQAAQGLPATFAEADLAGAEVPDCDSLLLVDVLYQLPEEAQLNLLARAATAARRRVVIRAFDPQAGWRSTVGRAMELANRSLRGDSGRASIRPLPLPVLAAPLEAQGFRAVVLPCWSGTPLPNVLLLAERGTV
jgi:SAM-dependent methyltransferase